MFSESITAFKINYCFQNQLSTVFSESIFSYHVLLQSGPPTSAMEETEGRCNTWVPGLCCSGPATAAWSFSDPQELSSEL